MEFNIENIVNRGYMDEKLNKLKNYTVYIYGAGSFGKETCLYLSDKGISVEAFLDKRAAEIKNYCGCPVYDMQDDSVCKDKANILVLFAIVMDKQQRKKVIESLYNNGFVHVEEAQYYRSLQITPEEAEHVELKDYFLNNQDKIKNAYSLLGDEKSRKIYESNIRAHFLKDYSQCELWEDAMDEQYFPNDIPFAKGYKKFVDCGGFIGDTVESLLNKKAEVQSVVTFEPDTDNFKTLSQSQKENSCQVTCFPCAVSDKTAFQRFSAARGSGMLCEDGETAILTVSLDEALHNYEPTFIKMDIEGAELNAIHGAKEMICGNTPDLAICVYHRTNHIWDILLLLNSFHLGYKFYLRSYNAYTMETVLYATVGEN